MSRKDLPRRKQNGVVVAQSQTFTGPLPHPDILIKYNDAVTNGAERIIAMAESQAAHRMKLEAMVIQGNIAAQSRGSIFGFIIGLIGVAGGIWLVSNGRDVVGLTALIGSLAALVAVFMVGRSRQESERRNRLENKQPNS